MKTEFIRFFTQDEIELQGLYFSPDDSTFKGVLHVHGLAGNFYENRFINLLAENYTGKGYAFLAFNNRGHDYLSDLLKKDGEEWKTIPGGGAHEIFAESIYDIDAAIHFLQDRGVTEICLQGHSSGANKVVFYQSQKQYKNVQGIILLSPCDDIGLQESAVGVRYNELLQTARALVEAGNGDKLMPEGSFFSYPMSAKSYLDYFGPESSHDIFPYRIPESQFREVSKLRCPVLALFGNNGEYVIGDIGETLNLLRSKAAASPRFDVVVVDGASHSYLGHEKELSTTIAIWLDEIMSIG